MKRSVVSVGDLYIVNRLRKWLEQGIEDYLVFLQGKEWYKEAQEFVKYISDKYAVDAYVVACVVAILSPNNKWERNKIDAEALIKAFVESGAEGALLVKVCTYNPNKVKAVKVLCGEIELSTKSPKTHSFAMNVGLNSPEHITVDKWHLRACVSKPSEGVVDAVESCTATQYRRIEALTSKVAKEFGLKGYEAQAIIWVKIKKVRNR